MVEHGPEASRVRTDKIYLVGFMACGKSTIARALARRLHWRHEDIDELIERRERMTVAEIFARHGEPYFRAAERQMLQLLLPMRHLVVATGGGTFADPENRTLINHDGVSVWIDLPLADIIPRIPLDGRRPLAADRAQLERLYTARLDWYRLAHVRVNAAHASTHAIVDTILDVIRQLPPLVQQPAGL
jgi:shikimate kinase